MHHLLIIGYSLLKINDTDSAINIFEKNALNDNYYGQLSSYYLGEILYKEGKYKFSLNAFYNAYLKKFDEEYSLDALYKYSIINYKIEKNDESLSSLIEIKEKYPDKTVLYISAEKFTQQYVESVKKNTRNDFIHFYQILEVLIIDEVTHR